MLHNGIAPLARNKPDINGVPVVVKNPSTFDFAPGEITAEWHTASEQELSDNAKYWSEMFDAVA